MKIYFTGSLSAKNQYLKNYQAIIGFLQANKHTVIADHILSKSEASIKMSSRKERLDFHVQLEKWIQSCDFMIAETSFPSISVGYEISLALRIGKPVLVLYSEGDPPSLLAHHESDRLECQKYDVQTVGQTIQEFIGFVQGKQDTRFTFFISHSQAAYLNDVSLQEKLPKSVYIRQLIDKDRRERRLRQGE